MSPKKPLSVVILHEVMPDDARPDELDALVQVEEVSATLQRLGWEVSCLAVDLDAKSWLTELRSRRADCVFNLVESLGGSGRLITLVPSLLAAAGIPFTGSGADAIYLSSHKLIAKRWMALHGVPTPAWLESDEGAGHDDQAWIVKSVWEHASLGLDDGCIVRGKAALSARLDRSTANFGGEWFAERFIDGREFNISVIEEAGVPRVLPIAEIRFKDFPADKPRIVGYAAKWDTDAPEYRNTPRVFPNLAPTKEGRLQQLAKKCWQIFRLRGYARVDIRMDDRGVPWVLEINANPCLSSDAGFVAAAAEGNLSFDKVIEAITDAALRPDLRPIENVI